jgi:prepilin-type N-terminal cleavage/methylation domain-containing protein
MLKIFKFKKGFTLIELLVVISVIAVLAVAVLSSINPVEQINKAKDTASKSDAAEYLNAMERFYATFGCYAWDYTAANTPPCAAPSQQAVTAVGSYDTTTLKLSTNNELKLEFANRLNNQITTGKNVLYVSSTAPTDANGFLMHVCFEPSSATFKARAKMDNVATGSSGTFYCVPGSD